MNEFVTSILDAATNPEMAGSDADRLRSRLLQAGLLATPGRLDTQAPARERVRSAGRRAASGKALAEFVAEGR